MAHISSIGAGMFSDLSVAVPATPPTFSALEDAADFHALFATEVQPSGTKGAGAFCRISNIREFPSFGTPPNIVNVPVYGSATSQQIQGQSDAPSLEITINYIPALWADGTLLSNLLKTKEQVVIRFALLNTEPTGSGATKHASLPAGLGQIDNTEFYLIGKLEAMTISPQLTDSNQATLTMSMQSALFGAYTLAST
jgi:hypothetical protein